jgi:hypothetical protein
MTFYGTLASAAGKGYLHAAPRPSWARCGVQQNVGLVRAYRWGASSFFTEQVIECHDQMGVLV